MEPKIAKPFGWIPIRWRIAVVIAGTAATVFLFYPVYPGHSKLDMVLWKAKLECVEFRRDHARWPRSTEELLSSIKKDPETARQVWSRHDLLVQVGQDDTLELSIRKTQGEDGNCSTR